MKCKYCFIIFKMQQTNVARLLLTIEFNFLKTLKWHMCNVVYNYMYIPLLKYFSESEALTE